MKVYVRAISLFLTVCLLSLNVGAEYIQTEDLSDLEQNVVAYYTESGIRGTLIESNQIPIEFVNPENNLFANPFLRGIDKPTAYHNLSSSNYSATLTSVFPSIWLYTNYYFKSNSSGRIYVKYSIKRNGGFGAKLRVGIFDLTQGTSYTDWLSSDLSPVYNVTESMYFSGLGPTHKYAIGFLSESIDLEVAPTLTGSAIVSHNSFVN